MIEATPDTYGWTKERILRVLLHPSFGVPAGRSLNQVATQAAAAYGWVHRTWQDLVAAGAFDAGRDVVMKDPAKAFTYWLDHRPDRVHADYHVVGGLDLLKTIVADRDLDYAATTYLAENLVQGHLFPRRFDLYVRPSQATAWHAALTKRGFPVDSSREDRGIVRLIRGPLDPHHDAPDVVDQTAPPPIRDETMRASPPEWKNPIRDVWLVQPPLLIVDLLEEGGACVEAAHMLMRKTYANAAIYRA